MPRLVSLFSELIHVRDVGLRQANDRAIWDWAAANGYSILTTDSDFIQMHQRLGWPPKVIRIEGCDFPFRIVEDMLRRNAVRISEFEKDAATGIFIIKNSG